MKNITKHGLIVLAISLAGWGCTASSPATPAAPASELTPAAVPTAPAAAPVAKPAVAPKTQPAAPVVKSYQDALSIYRTSGYYLQILNCRANPIYPTSLVLKKGAHFMIDNRDDRTHKFAVGKSTYTVKAFGYVIATATDVGTYNMTCDGGGAAGLNVQP